MRSAKRHANDSADGTPLEVCVKRVANEIQRLQRRAAREDAIDATSELYIAQLDLQKLVIARWFRRNYTLPQNGLDEGVEVLRSLLLRRLNEALTHARLPTINRRDPLWTEWFLGTVVQLDPEAAVNGKRVALCPRHATNAMADALSDVVDSLRQARSVINGGNSSSSSSSSRVNDGGNVDEEEEEATSSTDIAAEQAMVPTHAELATLCLPQGNVIGVQHMPETTTMMITPRRWQNQRNNSNWVYEVFEDQEQYSSMRS